MITSGKLTVFTYQINPNCYTPWFYVSSGSLRGLPAVNFDERGHIIPEGETPPFWYAVFRGGFRQYAVRKGPVRSTQQFR